MLKHYKKNQQGRDFVVGDIHGEYTKLVDQLNSLDFNFQQDRLFATGDLIDRGDDSIGCLNLLFEPWFYSVRGNHEQLMFDSILQRCAGSMNCWEQNGGDWFFDMYDNREKDNSKTLNDFLDKVCSIHELDLLPLAIQIETKDGRQIGIVHADPPLVWNESQISQCMQSVLWGRKLVEKRVFIKDIDHVFVGHTPITYSDKPKNFCGNITYIDSGAVFIKDRPLWIVEI